MKRKRASLRALSFSSSAGEGGATPGRGSGGPDGVWSAAGTFGRIAEPSLRSFIETFLLSAPHPALRATFPASRRRGNPPSRAYSAAMHVPRIDVRSLDETVEAVDLGQTPADVVVLSFSDSDLNALASAYAALEAPKPTLRLASLAALRHPYSIDLYCERVCSRGEADRGAGARRRRLLALRRRRAGGAGATARDQARAASGRPPRRSAARGGLDARARGAEPHLALFRRGRPRQPRRLPRLSLGFDRPGGGGAGARAGRGLRALRAGLPRRRSRRAPRARSSSTARSISPTIARRSRPWPRRSRARASRRQRCT